MVCGLERFSHPLILGHRGAPGAAPENTMRAFRLALQQGAHGVELDVQPSADGVPVVIHDATVERTTDGQGLVSMLPFEQLRRFDAGAGERIPRLDEVAEWAVGTGAWLNVELKEPGAEAASLAALRPAGLLPRTVFSSFHAAALRTLRRLAPDARRFLLTERWSAECRTVAAELDVHGICLGADAATPGTLTELRTARLPVLVWTVDEPARMRALLAAGVAGIITNRPDLGVAALRDGEQDTRPQVLP